MSGSIGANRIQRRCVKPTIDKFTELVLNQFNGFITSNITGSYNTGIKKDHGDIDLAIFINSDNDIKIIKKEFQEYLNSLEDNIIVPFKFGKNIGKKSQLYGNIVTCQFPIVGQENENVQIDNVIVKSKDELRFITEFLNLDAAKQALCIALVRVIKNPLIYIHQFNIKDFPELKENQEYEFVLSTNSLQLRIVTLNEERKQINKQIIWKSYNWDYVLKLLEDFNDADYQLDIYKSSYQELLEYLCKYYNKYPNDRAKIRIKGIINSMINIGVGEIGTEKGNNKQASIDLVNKLFNI